MSRLVILAAAVGILTCSGASAQAVSGVSFDAGAGLRYAPEYLGADKNKANPWLILRDLSFSAAPPGTPTDGFYVGPSANYVSARDTDDNSDLRGLAKVAATVELGVQAGYRLGPVDGYVTVRKGLGGHKGVAGEFGVRHSAPLSDRLTLNSGLEARYGNARYMDAYFGVTPDQSASSGLAAYEPSGGIRSVGASLELRYQASDTIAFLGQVRTARLVGDAADSPVVQDRSQLSAGVGVVRHFSFRF